MFKKISNQSGPIYIEQDGVFEFWSAVLASSPAANTEALFFGDASIRKNDRVIGFVAISLDKGILTRNIQGLLFRSILIVLVFLAIGSVITYAMVKGIIRPLRNLTDKVISFGVEGATSPVPIESQDEIGELAKAFNHMSDSLRRREEALRESETRYRSLFEDSPIGQWEADFSAAKEDVRQLESEKNDAGGALDGSARRGRAVLGQGPVPGSKPDGPANIPCAG